MQFLAHHDQDSGEGQPLRVHLINTGELAAEFAAPFHSGQAARRCGIAHDLGKYSDMAQRRIRGGSVRVDHSTAGAIELKNSGDIPAAFCVAGHHAGLPDGGSRADTAGTPTLLGRLKKTVEDYRAFAEEIELPPAAPPGIKLSSGFQQAFYIRMLYSCLTDADFLDTESFLSPPDVPRGAYKPLSVLQTALEQFTAGWFPPRGALNEKRCQILRACLNGGEESPGLFTLTVPTGGGKTVASMAFALRHAVSHGLRRIIYVIPYTSILEQTAAVFETIFGPDQVTVHYSGAGCEESCETLTPREQKRRLAAENWDAPIILTTSVQFFESLYASRSSRCRKLHNITKSVLIFDEAQMLPAPYLRPCTAAIGELAARYGCSAVLCTATQPALSPLFREFCPELGIRELCPDTAALYAFFRRVRYVNDGALSDEALVSRLRGETQALCVVNTRKQAQTLYAALEGAGTYHLSTLMTPAHRRAKLAEIRARLKEGLPCRVVSTSLIEAGVDVDFPAVYRQMAGLDSILQSGGRCNREGKQNAAESLVHIFTAEHRPPPILSQNITAAQSAMEKFADVSAPETVQLYFQTLLTLKGSAALDKEQILPAFTSEYFPFAAVAERFRLIDAPTRTVYIPTKENGTLLDHLRTFGPGRNLLRRLGQDSVNVYPNQFQSLLDTGKAELLMDSMALLTDRALYSSETGLRVELREGEGIFI